MKRMTIPGLVDAAAEHFGDRPFLRTADGARRSYAQTRTAAATMAGALSERGCRPGDRVAALLSNRVELVDLILGCAWLGAVVVPLNTALHGRLLRHALREAEPRFLYVAAELAARVADTEYPGRVWVVSADDAPVAGTAQAAAPCAAEPGDTAAILFTSGTTGPSRGVRCPQAQFAWWGRNVADVLRLTADDTLYTCLPLFHTNAINALAQAMTVGAEIVVDGRFSASRYWARAAQTGATCVYLLGAMVPMLLAQPPGEGDRAHRAWRTLAPATPAPLWEPFRERFGVAVVDGFGSTETNLVIGHTPDRYRPGYMGTVRDGFHAQAVDAELTPVPDGTPVSSWSVPIADSPSPPATWGNRRKRPEDGAGPATGWSASPTAGSASSTASRTASGAAARTSPRTRWRALSAPIRRSPRPRRSPSPPNWRRTR